MSKGQVSEPLNRPVESRLGWLGSIRGRLFIGLAACGLVPVAVIALTNQTMIATSIRDSEYEQITELTKEVARQIGAIMTSVRSDLLVLQTNPTMENVESSDDERDNEMGRLVDIYNLFSEVSLYGSNLWKIGGSSEESTASPRVLTRWGKTASNTGRITISTPSFEDLSDMEERSLFVTAHLPIALKKDGVTTGERHIAVARVPLDPVWELIKGVDLGGEGRMVLLNPSGQLLAVDDRNRVLDYFDQRYPVNHWRKSPKGIYTDVDGRRFAYVSLTIPASATRVEEPWTLISLVPEEEIVSAVREASVYQIMAAGGVLCLALIGGMLLSTRIARSMVAASAAADEVAHGKMGARIPDEGPREVRSLARAFNKMVEEVSCHREELESLVDIRTRKLQESQGKLEVISAQLRAAFESTREAILVVRNDGVVITANRRIKEYFGLPNQRMAWMRFEDVREAFFNCFADRERFEGCWNEAQHNANYVTEGEWEVVGPEPRVLFGYSVPVRNQSGEAFAHLWTFEDITRERELQRGLEQAQKMEAIGRLAGGVAHDFNNLLTGIIGNLSLVEMAAGGVLAKSGATKYIVTAKQAGERAAELVKQLLGFSRKSHLTLEHCDVQEIVEEVRGLLVHTIDPRISIEIDAPEDVWGVKVDPTQVQQVMMNLCVNAKDAMVGAGKIRLAAENVEVSDVAAGRHDAEAGSYVRISVTDTGHGIPEPILDKIFEPFFTTKEPGKGTGLGLATSYGIVQQHGGWIECDSEVGSGTVFSIYLPRDEREVVERPGEDAGGESDMGADESHGCETILLVDDDTVVRGVAESVLRHHGYAIVCASDGAEAVELVEERGDEFALVLLDLTMPKISGKDAFRMIRGLRPELPVLFCSGYLLTPEEFEVDGGGRPNGFVQKPYDVAKLAGTVRSVIDGREFTPSGEMVEA